MYALLRVILIALSWLQYLVFASVIISWLDADPRNKIVSTIHAITEPLYRPYRKLLRDVNLGPLDLAPLGLLMTIVFFQIIISRMIGHM